MFNRNFRLVKINLGILVMFVAMFLTAPSFTTVAQQSRQPTFGKVVVAMNYSVITGKPQDSLKVFPEGLQSIIAGVEVKNLRAGEETSTDWLRNGKLMLTTKGISDGRAVAASVFYPSPFLQAGNWEVKFFYKSKVVASTKFKVEKIPYIESLIFAEDALLPSFAPVAPSSTFQVGLKSVVAIFRYYGIDDTELDAQWYLSGKKVYSQKFQFLQSNGYAYAILTMLNSPLPKGKYELKIMLKGKLLRAEKFSISEIVDDPGA